MRGPPDVQSAPVHGRGAREMIGLANRIEREDSTRRVGCNVLPFPRQSFARPLARPIQFGNLFSVEVVWPSGATERIPNAFYLEMGTAALAARSMNWAWRAASP